MSLNPPLTHWAGRRVWIVGASSGIGLALAGRLHALGAELWLSARRTEPLQAFVDSHPGARALPLDATDDAALRQAVAQFADGPCPDLVCYCAGHYAPTTAADMGGADWEQHRRVNLDAPIALSLAVLPLLRQRGGGHLSLVSSVAGYRGLPRSLAYGTTKAALIHFAEALHLELRPQGVGVSVITPGFVATPMTARNDFPMPALVSPEAAADAIIQGWARGRFMIDFPRRFTRVLALLRCLPYRLYFPLVRRATSP